MTSSMRIDDGSLFAALSELRMIPDGDALTTLLPAS